MIIGRCPEILNDTLAKAIELQIATTQIVSPVIILEASRNSHQSAAIILAGHITQTSQREDVLNSVHVLIIAPEDSETVKRNHVEQLQKHLGYKVTGNTPRIVVFPDATQLSIGVQNALLKTAEELHFPYYIIFGVQQADQLLPTIQSRSQVVGLFTEELNVANDIQDFWNVFLASDIGMRKEQLDKHFSKKTKKGQQERERLESYIIALQQVQRLYPDAEKIKSIEYFRKICHTVHSQMILDSFLFL